MRIVIAAVAAMTVAGCTMAEQRAATGGVVGAGTGAIIGGLATGRPGGALAGAAIGGRQEQSSALPRRLLVHRLTMGHLLHRATMDRGAGGGQRFGGRGASARLGEWRLAVLRLISLGKAG